MNFSPNAKVAYWYWMDCCYEHLHELNKRHPVTTGCKWRATTTLHRGLKEMMKIRRRRLKRQKRRKKITREDGIWNLPRWVTWFYRLIIRWAIPTRMETLLMSVMRIFKRLPSVRKTGVCSKTEWVETHSFRTNRHHFHSFYWTFQVDGINGTRTHQPTNSHTPTRHLSKKWPVKASHGR